MRNEERKAFWFYGSVPWWQFWNPRSSMAGGLTFSVVIFAGIAVANLCFT